jgi:hypothetical protein
MSETQWLSIRDTPAGQCKQHTSQAARWVKHSDCQYGALLQASASSILTKQRDEWHTVIVRVGHSYRPVQAAYSPSGEMSETQWLSVWNTPADQCKQHTHQAARWVKHSDCPCGTLLQASASNMLAKQRDKWHTVTVRLGHSCRLVQGKKQQHTHLK